MPFGLSVLAVKAIAAVILLSALTAVYFGWQSHQRQIGEDRATIKYSKQIDELNSKAAKELERQKGYTVAAQRELRTFKDASEVRDATNKSQTDNLARRIRDLSSSTAGRLRDPNADDNCRKSGSEPGSGNTTGTVVSDIDGTKAGGLLSKPLTELLQSGNEEADAINLAYISCRADAKNLRERLRLLGAQRNAQ